MKLGLVEGVQSKAQTDFVFVGISKYDMDLFNIICHYIHTTYIIH